VLVGFGESGCCELQSACIRGSSARLKKRRGLGVWFRRYSCMSSFGIGVYSFFSYLERVSRFRGEWLLD